MGTLRTVLTDIVRTLIDGCAGGGVVNCLFTLVVLPLGLWVLIYGVVLLFRGETDSGVFLLLIAALLLGAVGSGLWRTGSRKSRRSRLPSKKDRPKKRSRRGPR